MDPITLSVAAATLLGRRALEALGDQAASGAWKGIEHLVEVIRDRFRGDAAASGALATAQAHPDDQGAIEALAAALRAHIESDEEFSRRLEALVGEAGERTGDIVVRVDGNAQVGKMVNIQRVDGSVTL